MGGKVLESHVLIGIGDSPLADFVKKYLYDSFVYSYFYPYPKFFDNKALLLGDRERAYIYYFKSLIRNLRKVRIALWADYTPLQKVERVVSSVEILKGIRFIVPIHSLSDFEIADQLRENGFSLFVGYASDKTSRDYEVFDFLKVARDETWYLGVSSKRELREALLHNFNGLDVTGYLFGSNKERTDKKKLIKELEELVRTVTRPRGKQTTLFEFV